MKDRKAGQDKDIKAEEAIEQAGTPVEAQVGDVASEPAPSKFTPEQLAELQELFTGLAPAGRTGRLRGWFRRNRARARTFVQDAAPRDEETEFDEDTFTGWLAGRASKNRGGTAGLALVAVLVIGGFWVMVLAGGLSLPLVAVILVLLLGVGLGLGLLFRRRRQ